MAERFFHSFFKFNRFVELRRSRSMRLGRKVSLHYINKDLLGH